MSNTYRRRVVESIQPRHSNDIDLLIRLGRETGTGSVHITRADAHAQIKRLRRDIAALERMARSGLVYRLDDTA